MRTRLQQGKTHPNNHLSNPHSTIRQVPDHQEVYLSPTTLTSLIFEINTYQTPSETTTIPTISSSSTFSSLPQPESEDIKATIHHFLDPILPPDHLSPLPSALSPPNRLTLSSPSLHPFAAYTISGTIISSEIDKKASSALPREWAQTPATTNHEIKVFQLLVRMEKYGTDFCVRVNVPLKEFGGDTEGGEREVRFGEEVLERVAGSLDVVAFELFGEEQ